MLDLQIPISPATIKLIKTHLLKALPDVKSSTRVEAAARGLGFETHAAMLAAARSGGSVSTGVDAGLFRAYLSARGIDVLPLHLYRAATRVAVTAVLESAPRLSMRGYGFHQPRWDSESKRWETPEESYAKFSEAREEFSSDWGLDQFLLAFVFVRRIPATKTIRTGADSYRLKHIAERMPFICPDGTELGPDYVSNGALIAAALHAGFKMRTYIDHRGYDAINVSFNMSKKAVDDLDCEILTDGALARRRAYIAEQRKYPRRYRQ
jgi:hypothetical protein